MLNTSLERKCFSILNTSREETLLYVKYFFILNTSREEILLEIVQYTARIVQVRQIIVIRSNARSPIVLRPLAHCKLSIFANASWGP